MRLTSTHESVEREEVSALALVETAAALGLSYAIYAYTGSLHHVAVAAAIAPFLLLRTHESTERGLLYALNGVNIFTVLFEIWKTRAIESKNFLLIILGLSSVPLMFAYILIMCILCKILATVYTLFIYPMHSLSAIPENWKKIVFCTDMTAMPELVPGVERIEKRLDILRLSGWISDIVANFREAKIVTLFIAVLSITLLYLPAAAYRWSLKSTALIWSPLLWVVRPAQDTSALPLMMKRIVRGGVVGISRLYSGAIVLLFIGKMAFWYKLTELRQGVEGTRLRQLFDGLAAPQEIPPWQLAAVASGVVTWVLFGLAKYHLQEMADGGTVPEEPWRTGFTAALVVRNFLAVYTGLCAVYILWSNLDPSLFPPLSTCLFPWSCRPAP